MEDNQPPKNTPPSNDAPTNTPPVATDDKGDKAGSSAPTNKQTEAYREQQSRADRAEAEKNELADRVAGLEAHVSEGMKDQAISTFLTENKDKYPLVTADDLKQFVNEPGELEEKAKYLQDRFHSQNQDTLASVREVPPSAMTQTEKDKAIKNIKPGPNAFAEYIRLQSTPVRK